MVSNQGLMQKVQRAKKQQQKKGMQSDDTKSIKSSRSSSSSSRSEHKPKPKMKFDVNTSNYVPYSAYEKRSKRYQQKYAKISSECKFHHLNIALNKLVISDEKDSLITEKNINILRYTFFKRISSNYDDMLKDMKCKKNGNYKLKFMRKLSENKSRERNMTNGLPNLSNDNLPLMNDDDGEFGVFSSLSEGESEDENDNVRESTFQSLFEEQMEDFDDFNNLYNQYQSMSSKKSLSIKSLIKSNQFWNNIQQDLKFNLMELSSSFNYFELLPNLSQLINLYKEIIEYFLINLNVLTVNTSDLTEEEKAKASKNIFFYFRDFNYEWFKIMSRLHYNFFNDQALINSNMSIGHDSNFTVHKNLVKRIIETIIENFKTAMNDTLLKSIFDLWSKFLFFIVNEMIYKNYDEFTEMNVYENLPEPTVGRSRGSSLNSVNSGVQSSYGSLENSVANSLLTTNTSTDETIAQITRNTKSLSINTHSLSNLSLNQNKISMIKEERDYDDMDSYSELNYKRKGFIIEPPTPLMEQGVFPTPLSATFSINSDETRLSKRLIFSKFKKNKIRV